jgi:parallel beta-helix repeat protein
MRFRQKIYILVVLLLTEMTMDPAPQAVSAQGCDFYASPEGHGNGLSEVSPFLIHDFLTMPESEIQGKTLCLMDGTYYEAVNISKAGTALQPITIRALRDGEVTIDGEGIRKPMHLTREASFIIVEGIVFKNSSGTLVYIKGNHNIFRRCSAYYGPDGFNSAGFLIDEGTNNLIEDCVAGSVGRHLFESWSDDGRSTNNTFRRCFAVGRMPDQSGIFSRSGFNIYGGSDDIIENGIVWGGTEYAAISIHSQKYEETYRCRNNKVLGSIMIGSGKSGADPDPGLGLLVHSGDEDLGQENARDNYFRDCIVYGNNYGIRITSRVDNTRIENCSVIDNSQYGISSENGSDVIKNSLILNNQITYSSVDGSFSYVNLYGNSSRNTPPTSCQHCSTVNPGNIGLTIPGDSPMKGAGENSEDIGANICYRYENGVLTDIPLWPWPMADRIKKELGIDVMAELEQLFGPIPAECKDEGVREDINLDGSVNSLDVQLCVNVLDGWETDADIVKRADVNGDGVVSSLDLQQIVRKVLGE